VACTFFAAEAIAALASPSFRNALPPLAALSTICWCRDAEDSLAFGPSSQVICSALRPCIAAQELSATTAMPPAVNAPVSTRSISNTWRTPGTALALVASNDFIFPPNTGQRATTAYCIPGTRESMPNFAVPLVFATPSNRGVALPTMVKSAEFFSGTVLRLGMGSFAASSASWP